MRATASLLALVMTGAAQAQTLPAPIVTIYPREIIRDDMLEDVAAPDRVAGGADIATNRATLVGRSARVTLPRGRPVPLTAIEEPRIVANGASVRLVFRSGGVFIHARGIALQAAAAGSRARVRNSDTHQIVTGVVLPDGVIEVSGE